MLSHFNRSYGIQSSERQYYELESYRIDLYHLPCLVYPTLKYDRGLFCSLLQDDNPTFEEKYPPRMRVERIDPSTNKLLAGTVMDIPFPASPSEADLLQTCTILFDNGTCHSTRWPVSSLHCLWMFAMFLQLNSVTTYEHEGQYHKGFLKNVMGDSVLCSSHTSTNKKRTGMSPSLTFQSHGWTCALRGLYSLGMSHVPFSALCLCHRCLLLIQLLCL
jgi:hypothetical protein